MWITSAQKYIFVSDIMTINEAETYCLTIYGTTLASIHNSDDNDAAYELCSSHPQCVNGAKCQTSCSIGAKYDEHNVWKWSDETEFSYWNWFSFSTSTFSDACAIILANNHRFYRYGGMWSSSPCDGSANSEQQFLCNTATNTITTTTDYPSIAPTMIPTNVPTNTPTILPTNTPTVLTTNIPTLLPTNIPTILPTNNPSNIPTIYPTNSPIIIPSTNPTNNPTKSPTTIPTLTPTANRSDRDVPSIYPTFNPTKQPTVKAYSAVNLPLILEVEYDFHSTSRQEAIVFHDPTYSSDSESIEMMTIYIAGGASGALMFVLLCVFSLFGFCLLRCWRHKQCNNADDEKEYIDIINDASVNNYEVYDHKHHYHHSVQLTESVFNTIIIDNDEGEEARTESSATMDEEKELLSIDMNLDAFLDFDDDKDFDEMYEASSDSADTPKNKISAKKGYYQFVDESMSKIKIDANYIQTYTPRTDLDKIESDESDSMSFADMYQRRGNRTKK